MPKPIAAPVRFWAKVQKTETCWLWTGAKDECGYGLFKGASGKTTRAHRFGYELTGDLIPAGLQLDHLCRVRNCVNPAHLEPVTARVNTLRGENPCAQHARKTHCIHGHELSGDNLILENEGRNNPRRRCRTCIREKARTLRARRRTQRVDSRGRP